MGLARQRLVTVTVEIGLAHQGQPLGAGNRVFLEQALRSSAPPQFNRPITTLASALWKLHWRSPVASPNHTVLDLRQRLCRTADVNASDSHYIH